MGSVLLKIGGLGFFLGFISWVAWAVMAVLSFEGLLYNGDFRWMSGAYFQAPYPRLIFYSILSLSLLFSAVGCFALSNEQGSRLEAVSGILFVITFLVAAVNARAPLSYTMIILFPVLFFLGLILWGATLWTIGGEISVPSLSRAASFTFIVSGAFGMLYLPVILYWSFELWLVFFPGWLYAAGSLMTALIFFRVSRTPQEPSLLLSKK